MALDLYTKECREAAEGRIPRLPDGSRPKGLRVFNSRVLEIFGLAHPITPALWWGPFVVYGLWFAFHRFAPVHAIGYVLLGLLGWSLFEYVLHRFIFHWPAHDEASRFRRFMLHWYHHEFPNDRLRLLAPPMMSWSIGPVIWIALRLACGPVAVWPVFAGTAAGYLAYDYIHYYTHHAKPKHFIGKWLRSYHLLHHHSDESETRFGVSSPLWDLVFGTYRPVRSAKRVAEQQREA